MAFWIWIMAIACVCFIIYGVGATYELRLAYKEQDRLFDEWKNARHDVEHSHYEVSSLKGDLTNERGLIDRLRARIRDAETERDEYRAKLRECREQIRKALR
jgi:uncharacterized coiled-coil DUF342 family protein